MSLNRWLSVILMLGLILALSPLGAQAEPYPPFEPQPYYHHPHGNAHGWDGPRHERHRDYYRGPCKGPKHPRPYVQEVLVAPPPPVAYVAPIAPIIAIQPYVQPQTYYSQPATQGLHGQFNFGF